MWALVVVGSGAQQLAGASGWGPISLSASEGTVELLQCHGRANAAPTSSPPPSMGKTILMRWLRGEHTDGQAGLLAKLGRARSVHPLFVCVCALARPNVFLGDFNVDRLLSGG